MFGILEVVYIILVYLKAFYRKHDWKTVCKNCNFYNSQLSMTDQAICFAFIWNVIAYFATFIAALLIQCSFHDF